MSAGWLLRPNQMLGFAPRTESTRANVPELEMSAFALRIQTYAVFLLSLCGPVLFPACASTTFDGHVYRSKEVAFRVGPIPESWRRVDSDLALLAFRDDPHRATVALNARCGKDGDDVPLQALTHHLFLVFTDRQVLSQRLRPLDGREALRSELTAQLDGVPKHFDVYVLKKDGCVYDFLYVADTSAPPQGLSNFERFVGSFATLKEP
jgi:hypothetical protein